MSAELVETCSACPEQYELRVGPVVLAYFRLRSGIFYVEVPDIGGECVYAIDWRATDPLKGCFDSEAEAVEHISNGIRAAFDAYMFGEVSERSRVQLEILLLRVQHQLARSYRG